MLITFNSMGYDYISKICFDFLKRIIPHTSWVFTFFFSLTLLSVYRWRTSLLSRQEKEKLQDISKMPS